MTCALHMGLKIDWARYEIAFRNAIALEIVFRRLLPVYPAFEDGAARFAKYNFAHKCVPKCNLGTSRHEPMAHSETMKIRVN